MEQTDHNQASSASQSLLHGDNIRENYEEKDELKLIKYIFTNLIYPWYPGDTSPFHWIASTLMKIKLQLKIGTVECNHSRNLATKFIERRPPTR